MLDTERGLSCASERVVEVPCAYFVPARAVFRGLLLNEVIAGAALKLATVVT